jgi:hypothetical protein
MRTIGRLIIGASAGLVLGAIVQAICWNSNEEYSTRFRYLGAVFGAISGALMGSILGAKSLSPRFTRILAGIAIGFVVGLLCAIIVCSVLGNSQSWERDADARQIGVCIGGPIGCLVGLFIAIIRNRLCKS